MGKLWQNRKRYHKFHTHAVYKVSRNSSYVEKRGKTSKWANSGGRKTGITKFHTHSEVIYFELLSTIYKAGKASRGL
jgi:hypothetical protein